ncbi:MAG: hypothetical protein MK193_05510 [Lentisphaeria bacterium]|nr:hypothetical protein [Lentisphaeria bacterium]
MGILEKIFGKKYTPEELHQMHIDEPIAAVVYGLQDMKTNGEFSIVRFDLLQLYITEFIHSDFKKYLPELLSEKQLEELKPQDIKATALLLLRDMMIRFDNSLYTEVIIENWEGQQRELLVNRMFEVCEGPLDSYLSWLSNQEEGQRENSHLLVTELAKKIMFPEEELWELHQKACMVVQKEIVEA